MRVGHGRLYDRRLPPHEARVLTYREHTGWVVKARMRRGADRIISADASGKAYWYGLDI